jgi:hypothetical protein
MIILRKRVGSLKITDEDFKDINICNDSIIKNNSIIFNYLPIKNLSFFKLNLEKSTIINKYWIYLDLNLQDLYNYIKEGKIITKRDLIFDIIKLSKKNYCINAEEHLDEIVPMKIEDIQNIKIKEYIIDNYYCFDSNYYKYNNIYFDINKRIITIDKAEKKRIKLPRFYIYNNTFDLSRIGSMICNDDKLNENIFIVNENNSDILKSVKNPLYNPNMNQIIYSENLNFQMQNYANELGEDFITQLELETNTFFYSKKNLFIFSNNLSKLTIKYLSFCKFEKIFINSNSNVTEIIQNFASKYNNMRINKKNNYNMLLGNFILKYRVSKIKSDDININYSDVNIDIPITDWNKISNTHFLSLSKNETLNISKFVEIGINEQWCNTYIENLKKQIVKHDIIPENESCPISLLPIDSFGVVTQCKHSFNLKYLIKWLLEKDDCPICRSKIDIDSLNFINEPNFNNFINIINQNKINVICDTLWYSKLQQSDNINIIHQNTFLNSQIKTSDTILNLSNLTNEDISFYTSSKIKFIIT